MEELLEHTSVVVVAKTEVVVVAKAGVEVVLHLKHDWDDDLALRRNDHYRQPHNDDDGLGRLKFSMPKFVGGTDLEEYLTWELKVDKIFCMHNYSDERKIQLASLEFEGYVLD